MVKMNKTVTVCYVTCMGKTAESLSMSWYDVRGASGSVRLVWSGMWLPAGISLKRHIAPIV